MLQAANGGVPISLPVLVQFFVFAFACGGLSMAVRSHDKRLTALEEKREDDIKAFADALKDALKESEKRHEKREERSVNAIERLGTSIQDLSTRLEVVVAKHETRLDAIDRKEG